MSEQITKINYHKRFLDEVNSFPDGKKPSLLIHVCCGPCGCYPLSILSKYFDVTVYFTNSNIYPEEEFDKRLNELKKLLLFLEKDYGYHINLITPAYDHVSYMKELLPFKDEKEGGHRCVLCYTKRMKEAFEYAEINGFDYFTTVMTVSRQKDSQIMNQIGESLQKNHKRTKYLYSDFKKEKGAEIGIRIRNEYGLYNQNYCGCEYSIWDENPVSKNTKN